MIVAEAICRIVETRVRGIWAPAFAGTTAWRFCAIKLRLGYPAKLRLHRPPRLDRLITGIDLDIAPPHHRAMRDVVLQLHSVRQADRQRAGAKACRRRHQLAPNRIAAFAVVNFARAQIALCDGSDVAAE